MESHADEAEVSAVQAAGELCFFLIRAHFLKRPPGELHHLG